MHRINRNQARLLLSADEARLAESLDVGKALLLRTSGDFTTVQIPCTTGDDVARVGRLLSGYPTATPWLPQRGAQHSVEQPTGSQEVARDEVATCALERPPTASAEARHAAQLFLSGKSPAEVVFELRGVTSHHGKRYQHALNDILALIREGLV